MASWVGRHLKDCKARTPLWPAGPPTSCLSTPSCSILCDHHISSVLSTFHTIRVCAAALSSTSPLVTGSLGSEGASGDRSPVSCSSVVPKWCYWGRLISVAAVCADDGRCNSIQMQSSKKPAQEACASACGWGQARPGLPFAAVLCVAVAKGGGKAV